MPAPNKLLARDFIAINLIVPVLLTVVIGAVLRLSDVQSVLTGLAVNTVITFCIMSALALEYRLLGKRIGLEAKKGVVRLLLHAMLVLPGVFLGSQVALFIAVRIFPGAGEHLFPRGPVLLIALPVTIAVIAISGRLDRLESRAKETELREERARHELLGAQLKALQARTNPHFLFNSLNTVAALIGEDPARAERALECLANLFRYALEGSERLKVTLAAELEAVGGYLEFERLRFGDRLRAVIEVAPEIEQALVPALVLQPLAENAVNHGVSSKRSGATVTIRGFVQDGDIVLSVEDDGPGPDGSPHRGTGTAQSDLSARLLLHYGERAKLITGPKDQGGFMAKVIIPFERALDDKERHG